MAPKQKQPTSAVQDNTSAGIKMRVVETPPEHDVAWAYAHLSDGTTPPVIRGDDLEDY